MSAHANEAYERGTWTEKCGAIRKEQCRFAVEDTEGNVGELTMRRADGLGGTNRTAQMIIDAHQHFWQPLRGDYGWMPEDNPTLNRAYAPKDLLPILTRHNIIRTILVHAAPSVAETG